MRLLLIIALALCGVPRSIFAQEDESPAVVESVISANPEPDSKVYLVSLVLKGGQRLYLRIPVIEAAKIIDGLSRAAGSDASRGQIAAPVVHGITMNADTRGKFILLQPRSNAGSLEPLAIPIEGADNFLQLFQKKIQEARANARQLQEQR
jgi:hypothetical protein